MTDRVIIVVYDNREYNIVKNVVDLKKYCRNNSETELKML